MVTVLLVDDDPLVRQGLRMLLSRERDLTVVGEAGDGVAAVLLARSLKPDIVLLDLKLPDADGIAVAVTMRAERPRSAVIVHSLRDNLATRERAREAGVAALVGKAEGVPALLATIRRIGGGPAA